ncbi:uncharacterized protein LOC141613020 [Silene latifolia]|uniref:uncharacterized protein LOC141613020 n=1 Tax=Silene latifolia TaxID=37657 RepID=UPI003D77241E
MLLHARLPKKFWGESLLTATHIINKLPSAVLGWKSPYEILFDKTPDYTELRVFGCQYYALQYTPSKDKFASKGKKCIFIGYPFGQKAFKLYDLDTHKIFVSKDVVFQESIFPFKSQTSNSTTNTTHSPLEFPILHPEILDDGTDHPHVSDNPVSSNPHTQSIQNPAETIENNDFISSLFFQNSTSQTNSPGPVLTSTGSAPAVSRQSIRTRQVSSRLKDFIVPPKIQSILPPTPNSPNSLSFSVFNTSTHSPSWSVSLNAVLNTSEPSTYSQAKYDPQWVAAMNKEIQALEENDTWELVSLPSGFKAIRSK